MSQAAFMWDVCASRHQGNPRSKAANQRAHPHKASWRERIRIQIDSAGFHGLTINELQIWDDRKQRFKPANELSPRLTELKAAKAIFDSGREREECAVYVSKEMWVSGSAGE